MRKSTILFFGPAAATALVMVAAIALFAVSVQSAGKAGKDGSAMDENRAKATFAGGCFWCMEHPFEKIDGVESVTSGYTGGTEKNPTYRQVSAGQTGHAESVEIIYDPGKVSYEQLLDIFWHQIDPTTADRSFVDHGRQYRSAIFYHDEEQRAAAERSRDKWEADGRFGKPIVTEIVAAGDFWPAEAYHQDYYKRNPLRYKYYRFGSGRDQYLKKVWGEEVWKKFK